MNLDRQSHTDCLAAYDILAEAKEASVASLIELVGAAERKVVDVRDRLIDHIRRECSDSNARAALHQVNVTLSELASLEYPGELSRAHIETARGLLEPLIRE